jgi:hypothetical protein
VDGVLSTIHAILKPSGEWAFDQPGTSVKVPVPTATGQALRQGSKAVIADATADGEALAHSQDGAVLKGLTIGGGGTYPRVSIDATIAGYLDFKKSGVGEFYISNGQTGGGRLSVHALAANRHPIEIQADGRLDLDDALAVTVPVPTTTGHALRQGSNATVSALTATNGITASGAGTVSLRVGSSVVNVVGLGSTVINRATSTPGDSLLQVVSSAGTSLRVDVDGAEFTVPVTIPAATAATHAAQVSAIDAATGRLAIGGRRGLNDTGWRNITSLCANVDAGNVYIRRRGDDVELSLRDVSFNAAPDSLSLCAAITGFTADIRSSIHFAYGDRIRSTNTSAKEICVQQTSGNVLQVLTAPNATVGTASDTYSGSVRYTAGTSSPTVLPGTQVTAPGT